MSADRAAQGTAATLTVSVIIPTYNRSHVLRRCLDCLMAQEPRPDQIIVVDASRDDLSQQVCAEYPTVTCLRNPEGRGNTPSSRNMALRECTGGIIAFLDDDAFAHPGWVANLISTFRDPEIGGVAGRALNGVPGEENMGKEEIGKLLPNGMLTGNFAASPGRIVEVDHMIGCNMSVRKEVIARLGGFRDDFKAGPFGICEETELCVRAKRLGYRLVFNPAVCADHVGAAQPGGKRFSPKYTYFHTKNNLVMLIRNWALGGIVWRHIAAIAITSVRGFLRKLAGAVAHCSCAFIGLVVGLLTGIYFLIQTGVRPERSDEKGRQISELLSRKSELVK